MREEILSIISQYPKSYTRFIKKNMQSALSAIEDTCGESFGEKLYNWIYPECKKTCTVCQAPCVFKQFSRGYYDFCSCSCRAKHHQSYKNAHTVDGSLKDVIRSKNAAKAAATSSKRKATLSVVGDDGLTLQARENIRRSESYIQRIHPNLKDLAFLKSYSGSAEQLAAELDVPYSMVLKAYKRLEVPLKATKSGTSKAEKSLLEFIKSLNVECEPNKRGILAGRREIDIWIPALQLGIEYCGLYWHSDRNGYDKDKHQRKFIDCVSQGILLLTIFEDEWIFKPELVKSRLRSILHKHSTKIHARKCAIETRPTKEITSLLDSWHIAGSKSSAHNLCLIESGRVVSILTYGKPRYSKEDVEIIRFASLPGSTVVGGFSKLFHHLVRNLKCESVVSYSDNRWGTGGVYATSGFVNAGISPPSYYYFKLKDRIRFHRSRFMKHRIISELGGRKDLTEHDNMKALGYSRIFDCGTTKWVWSKV